MAAFGNDGLRMTFGRADFLGVGISFCLTITVPLILIAYLCGGNLFVLVTCPLSIKVLTVPNTYYVHNAMYIYYAILPYFSRHFYVNKSGL